ncbi:MAG: Gfo/Idh/MocA family oxidoreductase [Saprospirales bacterium]|nr:Gfo/Idh/MocA family oxidoreductase [Saprospirales bacterium]
MKTFKIGIIGYGGFGAFLHQGWKQLPQVQVTAIAEEDASKLKGLDGVKITSNWRDLLQDPDIDLIAIVTPPSTHETMAIACMEAGKHVFIEKPLTLTVQSAQKIMEVRDQTGMAVSTDFIMRFNPLIRELRRLTQEGVFGKLRRVDVENYAQDEQLPLDHWFWEPERSGGILIEHGIHFFDIVHFLSPSKVLTVNGLHHMRNPRQEDQVLANVVYEGGLIATHYHSFARPGFFETTKIKLAYDLADLELHGWIPLWADVKMLVNAQTKKAISSSSFFEVFDSTPVDRAADESRPSGWGLADGGEFPRRHIKSGGLEYQVEEVLTGKFNTGRSKEEVYTSCVQDSLLDVLQKMDNPAHLLTAPLEAGLASLEVAIRATEFNHRL